MAKKINIPTIEQCETVSQTLKVMAHPQRMMILCQLCEGPKTVGDLEELSGATQSAVSQFLNRMKLEKLVTSRRHTHFVYYEIADPNIMKLVQSLHNIYCK
ncbi:MAG TPA: ArsR family transcriptional regulator [Gammaproteobacteria bacterium]|jgi:ArsR family transcriptional regulator|nr:ArsR family transcriptional regulator [Gammaproteobacteria bacterium]